MIGKPGMQLPPMPGFVSESVQLGQISQLAVARG
jgi:hypothetical protein